MGYTFHLISKPLQKLRARKYPTALFPYASDAVGTTRRCTGGSACRVTQLQTNGRAPDRWLIDLVRFA